MAEPSSGSLGAVPALRGLWDEDVTPVCLLDEDYNLAYRNPAFDRLALEVWHLSPDALQGTSLLTGLPLPAPLLLALAGLKVSPKPERLTRLRLDHTEAVWDVQLLPYKQEGRVLGVVMLFQDRTGEVRQEQANNDQRRLLAAILEAAPEAIVWVTPDGQARVENEPAAQLFGVAPIGASRPIAGFLEGGHLLDLDGQALEPGLCPFEAARAGRRLGPNGLLLRRPGQPDRHLRVSVTPVLPVMGQPGGALVTLLELPMPTAPCAGEPPFLETLLGAMPSVLYYIDTAMRIQMANRYMLQRLGMTADQVIGRPIQEVMPLSGEYLTAFKEALNAGTLVHRPYVSHVDSRSGRRTVWDNYVAPVQDAEGRMIGLVVLSNDVTWRVELTQALSDKVHQLATIVAHISDAVVVAAPNGDILLTNDAAQRILHLAPHDKLEVLDRADVRTLHDRPIHVADMPVTCVLRGERVADTVLKLRREDGQEVVLTAAGTPITDEQGQVLMGVVVFHDITEEFRLREALTEKVRELEGAVSSLQEIDRLKTNFLNTISHELRTPLTNIIGYVELIEDQVLGPLSEPQQETVHQVMESARHLLTLINDLLDFTQLEAGKIVFSYSPIELGALVQQVVPAVRTKSGKCLPVTIEESPELPRARADHNRVMQVLENLLDNAFKFTPLGGHITVGIRPDGPGMVRLTVTDTGIGIPEEAQEHLFSKFYQVESGLRREAGGTGLGLAICKLLVEKQGGAIGLVSKPGEGTQVWFTLPVWDEGARTSPSEAS